jgi:dTDP-4-dehydrorhamnose reductase
MSLVRPRIVILAAADANVERCEREPEAARRVNVDAARSVIEAAREIAASVVVFSSEYVFDGRYGPYSEDDATRPINEYGRQKVTLESLAQSLQRHLVCRTSGVFGWEPAGKNFVCQLIRRLRSGSEFVVPSDQVITPTYAPELSRAVVGLLDRSVSGTIHVVGPRVLARAAFARLAARAFGLPENLISERPTAELGLGAPRPLNAGLRDGRLRAMLGDALLEPAAALAAMRAAEGAA